jgi:DUF177 domain-containing protein
VSLVIDVRDLIEQPGSSRSVRVDEPILGLGTELASVPEDRRVEAVLLFESVVEGVLVSGPVTGAMVLSCARCLKSFHSEFHLQVQELFAPGAIDVDDEYPLGEGSVDLEPMIRDAVLLSMPFAPLCRTDCQGLCERCGGDRNLGECTCDPVVDPRWQPLVGLDLEPAERAHNQGNR